MDDGIDAAGDTGLVDLTGVTVAQCDGGLKNSLLFRSCQEMHRSIPKSYLLTWIKNMASYLEVLAGDGGHQMPVGCSCSGTGIWNRVNDLLLQQWKDESDVDSKYAWDHKLMCKLEAKKQDFLLSQFSPDFMFKDVTKLADGPAWDTISGSVQPMPEVSKYGSGFSCKDLYLSDVYLYVW